MKIETGIEMLLPTVQWGNIKLFTKVAIDSVTDLGRVEETQKRLGIKGEKTSTETLVEVSRRLAVEELTALKRDVDKLVISTFEHEKFAQAKK